MYRCVTRFISPCFDDSLGCFSNCYCVGCCEQCCYEYGYASTSSRLYADVGFLDHRIFLKRCIDLKELHGKIESETPQMAGRAGTRPGQTYEPGASSQSSLRGAGVQTLDQFLLLFQANRRELDQKWDSWHVD